MNIAAVAIDLAKNVFQVHAVDARGKVVLRKQLRRAQAVCNWRLWVRSHPSRKRALGQVWDSQIVTPRAHACDGAEMLTKGR
jgi:hypothetical protein